MQHERSANRGVVAAVAVFVTVVGIAGPLLAGGFAITYTAPPQELAELVDIVRAPGVIEQATEHVNSVLRLPREVPVVFAPCGTANAFYDPGEKRIVFCYEFIALFEQVLVDYSDLNDEEIDDAVIGSTLFFLLHEMGHALINVYDLPITGREEDAVDDLAALILIDADAHDDLLSAADSFDLLAASMAESGVQLAFWDEHSLSAQRAYTMTCMVFGADPQTYGDLVGPYLPEERARRCPGEFAQKVKSWDRLLTPFYNE